MTAVLHTRSGADQTRTQPLIRTTMALSALKRRQQAVWARGDFAVVGTTLQIVGESLAEAIDVRADERVLDVAAGSGNASLAAGRRFARVTSTDYVAQLLEKGAARARVEGLPIDFQVADAEDLPFGDGSFDVVLSTFGAMFAPDHRKTAQELMRVVRSGGRIGMANWTPQGLIGQLFALLGTFIPPPADTEPPALWGTEGHIVKLFGPQASEIRCARRTFMFRYRSPEHWIDFFRTFYGPVLQAFAALEASAQARLHAALAALLERSNVAGPGSLVVPGEYLEVVVCKH